MKKFIKIVSIVICIALFALTFAACNTKKDLAYTGIALDAGTVGVAYTANVATAEGKGDPSVTYTLKGSDLPAGLVFNNGAITGTPMTATNGTVSFTVIAKAADFNDTEAEFSINIKKADIIYSSSELIDATVGVAYSGSVASATAVGGAAITYEMKQGSSLPAGLVFDNGAITGTPTQPTISAVSFTVIAKVNNNYNQAEAQFSIEVGEGNINYSASELVDGTVGITYSASVATAVSTAAVNYSLKEAGSLPAGLTFNNGAISGTPTAAVSEKSFAVIASAYGYADAEETFSITIASGTINYENESLVGTTGVAFSKDLKTAVAEGALTPVIEYNLKSGTLPAGLNFNNGLITGTPTQKTIQPAIITVTAGAAGYTSKDAEFTIEIGNEGEITYAGSTLSAKVGAGYNRSIATAIAGGSSPVITYTLKSGTLPGGLSFNNGQISGTPTAITAAAAFVVTASAENFDPKDATFTISVTAGTITYAGSALSEGTTDAEYTASVATASAEGTITPTFTYEIKAGSTLPIGLDLSTAGQITGTPTEVATNHSFTVVANATNFASAEAVFMITIIQSEKNSFIFETAVADLSRFKGGSMYYGGEHTGPSVLERTGIGNNEWDTAGHLTPYFLQGTHNSPGQTVTWMINSSAATTATLKMSLSIEIPGTFNMNSDSNGGGHIIKVNDDVLTYSGIVLSRQTITSIMQFNLWTISTVNLKAGLNIITFTTGMNEWLINFDERYTEVGGPAIECIMFETNANLSWATGYPNVDNLLTKFPFDEWSDPNN